MTDHTELRRLAEAGLKQIASGNGMSILQWNSFSNAILSLLDRLEQAEAVIARAKESSSYGNGSDRVICFNCNDTHEILTEYKRTKDAALTKGGEGDG
jgi:hypothetical protein